jgi:hypothetical protein
MARSRLGERCHGAMACGAADVRLVLDGLPMGGGTRPSGCTTAAEKCSKAAWVVDPTVSVVLPNAYRT